MYAGACGGSDLKIVVTLRNSCGRQGTPRRFTVAHTPAE